MRSVRSTIGLHKLAAYPRNRAGKHQSSAKCENKRFVDCLSPRRLFSSAFSACLVKGKRRRKIILSCTLKNLLMWLKALRTSRSAMKPEARKSCIASSLETCWSFNETCNGDVKVLSSTSPVEAFQVILTSASLSSSSDVNFFKHKKSFLCMESRSRL